MQESKRLVGQAEGMIDSELGNLRGEQFAHIMLARLALAQGRVQPARDELAETVRFCTQNQLG